MVVRSFEDNETLTGIAFIDVQIYVTSVKVVKNTIILADAYKSVWFVGFQDEPTKLVMLGKDYNPMEAMNVSYLIENQTLHIVVADSEKNIRLLQYAPFSKIACCKRFVLALCIAENPRVCFSPLFPPL